MRIVLLAVLLGACATADKPSIGGNQVDASTGGGIDSSTPPIVDAPDVPPADAGPMAVSLTQNANPTPIAANSIACQANNITAENSYYRVFGLADHGITGELTVNNVGFAVESADAGGAGTSQPATLRLAIYGGTPGGTLQLNMMTPVTSMAITIPDGNLTMVNVPITAAIPPNSQLVVELAIPDGAAAGHSFFLGSNNAGETKPGYIRAPSAGCDITQPTDINAVTANAPDYIFVVNGTH